MDLDKCEWDVAREAMLARWFGFDEGSFARHLEDWYWMRKRLRDYSPERDPRPGTLSGQIMHEVLEYRKGWGNG